MTPTNLPTLHIERVPVSAREQFRQIAETDWRDPKTGTAYKGVLSSDFSEE